MAASRFIPSTKAGMNAVKGINNAAVHCVDRREKAMEDQNFQANDILGGFFNVMKNKGEAVDYNIVDIDVDIRSALWVDQYIPDFATEPH